VSEADLLARVTGPDGRSAELRKATWDHVLAGHPEMTNHLADVIRTIESPEFPQANDLGS
jgi:hypothetical protein